MVIKKCKNCSKTFRTKENRATHCSAKCSNDFKKKGKKIKCFYCGNKFYVSKYRISSAKYCSKYCAYMGKKKYNLPLKQSIAHHGYITTRTNGKIRYLHRVIMEKNLGRKLLKGEVVHHINGIKGDNRIENLELIKNNSLHKKRDVRKADRDKLGRFAISA